MTFYVLRNESRNRNRNFEVIWIMRKRVGIFGGTFDPPHKGHVEICRYLLKNNDCDEVWIVPVFDHPYAKKCASFDDRITMCRFAFGSLGGKVKVLDTERQLGGISFTINTVSHLQSEHPDIKFSLIMGSDTLAESRGWKDADKLRGLVPFLMVARGEHSEIPNISSTDVRNCIKNGEKFADLVPQDVAVYIVTHGLYS